MTYQLHLYLSTEMEELLRAYAEARGISISAAVRIILHQALSQS